MLQIQSVSIEFPVQKGVIRPVDQVCLKVGDRERHVIIGETGSGKSVLLMGVLGLSGGSVTGSILWNGRELVGLPPKEYAKIRGREIAYIPQGNASGMNPIRTIGWQIGEPLRVHQGVRRKDAFTRAVEALKNLDFQQPERWARGYPHHLSGGMKQRALVAMGTVAGGNMLLADEPTKGLDEERREEVEELFQGLADTALLCVTHDLNFARAVANRISVMYAGQIVETCSREEFFQEPIHPYSRMMIASLPENGFHFPKGFAPSHADYEGLGCRFADRCPNRTEACEKHPPRMAIGERMVQCWNVAGNKETE